MPDWDTNCSNGPLIDLLHGDGYGIAHRGASCPEIADAVIVVVLDQAAEQIKALPTPYRRTIETGHAERIYIHDFDGIQERDAVYVRDEIYTAEDFKADALALLDRLRGDDD